MSENDYNKIIRQVARELLEPEGLIQVGRSRNYLDDNGWYITHICYQPYPPEYGYKGTFIQIGINYLWSFYGAFDYGSYRHPNDFIEYTGNDEEFYNTLSSMTEDIVKKIKKYRSFSDLNYAKKKIYRAMLKEYYIENWMIHQSSNNLYDRLMICGLTKNKGAYKNYKALLKETKNSDSDYELEYRNELLNEIQSIILEPEKLQEYVREKIRLKRKELCAMSGLKKKMNPEYDFDDKGKIIKP